MSHTLEKNRTLHLEKKVDFENNKNIDACFYEHVILD